MKDLSNYRKSYDKSELLENQIPEDPINLFHRWFYEAEDLNAADEVNAMTVATIGLDGFPKSRVVLLKKFNEEGFIFYTNCHFFGQELNVRLLSKELPRKQLIVFPIIILLHVPMEVN